VWGITASDSVNGYIAWGGPPRDPAIDGTIVPAAAGGSLMLTPDISLAALRAMKEQFGSRIYGRYGFVDAFNPTTNWVGPDVIGINIGPILLSAENLRTGNIWRWFMRNREISKAMRLIGLHTYTELPRRSLLLPQPRAGSRAVSSQRAAKDAEAPGFKRERWQADAAYLRGALNR
jgi:hypothetical protein